MTSRADTGYGMRSPHVPIMRASPMRHPQRLLFDERGFGWGAQTSPPFSRVATRAAHTAAKVVHANDSISLDQAGSASCPQTAAQFLCILATLGCQANAVPVGIRTDR